MQPLDIRRLFSLPAVYDLFQSFVGANALKRRFITDHIPTDRRLRILEVGCGPGKNLEYLPPSVDYVGCDLSDKYIAHAKKRFGDRAEFYCLSVADIGALKLEGFDLVMSIGTLHHLSDTLVSGLCSEIQSILKEDGSFLALEPCWTPTQSWLDRTIMSYDRGEDIRYMEGYTDLLKQSFATADATQIETADVIIYPTSACVIRAGGRKPESPAALT